MAYLRGREGGCAHWTHVLSEFARANDDCARWCQLEPIVPSPRFVLPVVELRGQEARYARPNWFLDRMG